MKYYAEFEPSREEISIMLNSRDYASGPRKTAALKLASAAVGVLNIEMIPVYRDLEVRRLIGLAPDGSPPDPIKRLKNSWEDGPFCYRLGRCIAINRTSEHHPEGLGIDWWVYRFSADSIDAVWAFILEERFLDRDRCHEVGYLLDITQDESVAISTLRKGHNELTQNRTSTERLLDEIENLARTTKARARALYGLVNYALDNGIPAEQLAERLSESKRDDG